MGAILEVTALAKIGTLEEFIEKQLQNRLQSGEIMGIGDYAIDKLDRTSSPTLSVDAEYKKSLSSYGALAEELDDAGLLGSGYAKYLDTVAGRRRRTAIDTQKRLDSQLLPQNGGEGYEDYVKSSLKDAEKLYEKELLAYSRIKEKAYKRILSKKAIKLRDAYAIAEEMGLEGEDAENIARKASGEARTALMEDLLEFMIKQEMTYDQANAYARSQGLGVVDSRKLAEAVKKMNQDIGEDNLSGSYLDYLREQEKN